MSRDKYFGKYMNKDLVKEMKNHLKIVKLLEAAHGDLLKKDQVNMSEMEEFRALRDLFEKETKKLEKHRYVNVYSFTRNCDWNRREKTLVDITQLRDQWNGIKEYCRVVPINYDFYKDLKIPLADNKHDNEKAREAAKWDRWSAGSEIKKLNPHRAVIDYCDRR